MHTACHHCDHLCDIPALRLDQVALCPGCGGELAEGAAMHHDAVLALGLAALILLFSALLFEFVALSTQGLAQSMGLIDASLVMVKHHYEPLALLLLLTIILLPTLVVALAFVLHTRLRARVPVTAQIWMTKALFLFKEWSMPEIFLVGVAVSLVKISVLADIAIGLSFWGYIGFVLFFLALQLKLNRTALWDLVAHHRRFVVATASGRAVDRTLASCPQCGLLSPPGDCRRCHTRVRVRDPLNVQKTLAWLCTAALLYIPANLLPILISVYLTQPQPATIIGGVVTLWESGSYPVAIVIFVASVVLPLAKIAAFAVFCWVVTRRARFCQVSFSRLYMVAEFLGKWSMIDVFVVAILAALVQLAGVMEVVPGIGTLFFSLMVITSMIAAHTFDPRQLWDIEQAGH